MLEHSSTHSSHIVCPALPCTRTDCTVRSDCAIGLRSMCSALDSHRLHSQIGLRSMCSIEVGMMKPVLALPAWLEPRLLLLGVPPYERVSLTLCTRTVVSARAAGARARCLQRCHGRQLELFYCDGAQLVDPCQNSSRGLFNRAALQRPRGDEDGFSLLLARWVGQGGGVAERDEKATC